MKYVAFPCVIEDTFYSGKVDLHLYVGDNSLPDPDMSCFKTAKEMENENDVEFSSYSIEYEEEAVKVRNYMTSLGYEKIDFINISI